MEAFYYHKDLLPLFKFLEIHPKTAIRYSKHFILDKNRSITGGRSKDNKTKYSPTDVLRMCVYSIYKKIIRSEIDFEHTWETYLEHTDKYCPGSPEQTFENACHSTQEVFSFCDGLYSYTIDHEAIEYFVKSYLEDRFLPDWEKDD